MNIYDLADEEHRLTHEAEDTHGDYFINAAGVTLAFSNLVGIPLTDCETFLRFYAQAKKHHTLSVLSTVRHHRTQAKLNLRYFWNQPFMPPSRSRIRTERNILISISLLS